MLQRVRTNFDPSKHRQAWLYLQYQPEKMPQSIIPYKMIKFKKLLKKFCALEISRFDFDASSA